MIIDYRFWSRHSLSEGSQNLYLDMEAVGIGSPPNPRFTTPLYTMSPCEGFRNSPPSSFPPHDRSLRLRSFLLPLQRSLPESSRFRDNNRAFRHSRLVRLLVSYSPQTEGLKRIRKGARGDPKREER